MLSFESPRSPTNTGSVCVEELNSVIHVQPDETLNEAVTRATLPARFVPPEGVTTFTDLISPSDSVEIVGQPGSVLQSDGARRLTQIGATTPDADLTLRDVTVDMNHVVSVGVVFGFEGGSEWGSLTLEDVTVENIDLSDQVNSRGVIHAPGTLPDITLEECNFRMDTAQNRQDAEYCIVKTESGSTVERFTARDCYLVGDLITLSERDSSSVQFFRGFKIYADDHALVENCIFDSWDQYATFLNTTSEDATVHVDKCVCRNSGDGDMFRVGAYSGGGTVKVTDCTYNRPANQGDRAIIVQGEVAIDSALIEGNTTYGSLVPIEVNAFHAATVRANDLIDTGTENSAEPRWGIQLRDRDDVAEDATVRGNRIVSSGSKYMDSGVIFDEESGDWGGVAEATDNIIRGYETSQVTDNLSSITVTERDNSE